MKSSSELWPRLDEGSKAHAFAVRHFKGVTGLRPFPATPTTWSCATRVIGRGGDTIGIVRVVDPGQVKVSLIAQEFELAALAGAAGIGPAAVGFQPSDGLMAMCYLPPDAGPVSSESRAASFTFKLQALHHLRPTKPPLLWQWRQHALAQRFARARPWLPEDLLATGTLLAAIDSVLAGTEGPPASLTHGDLNPTNMIWSGGQGWLIDYDHAGWGDPLRDVATLVIALRLTSHQEEELLAASLRRTPLRHDWWRYRLFAVSVLLRYGLDVATLRATASHVEHDPCELGPPPLPFDLVADECIALERRLQHLSSGFLVAASQALQRWILTPTCDRCCTDSQASQLAEPIKRWRQALRIALEATC